jgi:hypothetical protein
VELLAGMRGREYPNLVVSDTQGEPATYTEGAMRLGVQGGIPLGPSLTATGLVVWQTTDARDVVYDGTSWLLQGTIGWSLGARTYLEGVAVGQIRRFPSRIAALDNDSYWQAGVGLRRAVGGPAEVALRYAYASYSQSAGGEETVHRATMGITLQWGGSRAAPPSSLALPLPVEEVPPVPVAGPCAFRILAPDAQDVFLVGDFNGWDPRADAMTSTPGGWWKRSVDLPPGTFQYAYLVDGRLVTPPEADTVVDDGFGGRNGVIRVAAADR